LTNENETLRWPTNLDHAAIVERLVKVRDAARAAGFEEFAARFDGVGTLPPGQLGAKVIGALTWVQDKADYHAYAIQLEMIAVNLKNLK